MSKRSKKSKGKGTNVDVAVAVADDTFDKMLAELRAADVTSEAAASDSRNSSSSSTATSLFSTTNQARKGTAIEVTEEALLQACNRGDIWQLRRWARRGLRVTCANPSREAVLHGKYEAARCLVRELGADVNQADEKGFLPLGTAACLGSSNVRMVKFLAIELGADVNQTDAGGHTPFLLATIAGHLPLMRCLVKELGANVNTASIEGLSPLYMAAHDDKLDLTQFLLVEELGAGVNIVTKNGSTPLMIAASFMNHKITRYLLKHGADPQLTHSYHGTAVSLSNYFHAPVEETTYLEARTNCANPGCTNAGLKKCERCLQAYFCGNACIRAYWPAHKTECTAAAAKLKATRAGAIVIFILLELVIIFIMNCYSPRINFIDND
jgi:hypothetical protein